MSTAVQIQVNYSVRNTPDVTKTELKKIANKSLNVKNWKTERVDVKTLSDIIAQGYTVQPAIKRGRADSEGVKSIQWVFLDFDYTPVEQTLKGDWSNQACMWYRTPSYIEGENHKHRLVFKLARAITSIEEYEHLAMVLINIFYRDADPIYNPSQIFFGAYDENSVHILNENATLDPDIFLQMSLEGIEIKRPKDDKQQDNKLDTRQDSLPDDENHEGIRGQVLRWVTSKIWNDVCANDIDKLYCLHPHKFQEQDKDRKNLAKWGGHRPEDKEKDYGTGFYVHWAEPNYPPRFVNQGAGFSGTFIDYWHHYGKELHGKRWGSIEWNDDRDYKNYQAVCDDIARWFKVDCFDFDRAREEASERRKNRKKEKLNDLQMMVETTLKQYVMTIKKGSKDGYLYYDFPVGVWRVKPTEVNVYRDCVKYALKHHYGLESSDISDPKLASWMCSVIKYFDEFPSVEDKLDFDKKRIKEYIPMANGDYNWQTKEFSPAFNPSINNQVRSSISYRPTDENSKGVQYLNSWLDGMRYTPEQKKAIKAWLVVNFLGIATQTKRMLCVFGTPNTGKTVIGQLIVRCLGELGAQVRGSHMTDANNRFANQNLDNRFAVFIDEFSATAKGWELIKEITGNASIMLEIEKKGLPSYSTEFIGGITTATQDKFYIPNSDDGGIRRRIVLIKHTPQQRNDDFEDADLMFARPDIYEDIYNWGIQQDGNQAVKDFIAYAKSQDAKDILQESLIQNDRVLMFMAECLEFTDNEDNTVTNHQLQAAYQMWLETVLGEPTQNDLMRSKISKIPQYIREKAEIPDNNIPWKFMPEKGKDAKIKTSDGKYTRGFKGILIKMPD